MDPYNRMVYQGRYWRTKRKVYRCQSLDTCVIKDFTGTFDKNDNNNKSITAVGNLNNFEKLVAEIEEWHDENKEKLNENGAKKNIQRAMSVDLPVNIHGRPNIDIVLNILETSDEEYIKVRVPIDAELDCLSARNDLTTLNGNFEKKRKLTVTEYFV